MPQDSLSDNERNDALRTIRRMGGTVRTSNAIRAGIHLRTLYLLRDNGYLEMLSRCIYPKGDKRTLISCNPNLTSRRDVALQGESQTTDIHQMRNGRDYAHVDGSLPTKESQKNPQKSKRAKEQKSKRAKESDTHFSRNEKYADTHLVLQHRHRGW